MVAEAVYVLESLFGVPRAGVAELVRAIIGFPPIIVIDHELLLRALEGYEVHRLDFAEAHLVALSEVTGIEPIASFDRSIDRIPRAHRVEPAF